MEWWTTLLLIIGGFILLATSGLPVAYCFLTVNIISFCIIAGGLSSLSHLILSMKTSISMFAFVPVVMFVLMGEILFHSGVFSRAINSLDNFIGRVPGRLGLLAVAGGTLFASMSGSSLGGTAMLGSILIPEMEKRGYKKPISLGPILGCGGLAVIIPPSSGAVIIGVLAKISIGKLLVAGALPGLLIAALYTLYIIIRCTLQPSIAPPYVTSAVTLSKKVRYMIRDVLPFGSIVFIAVGLIFFGVCTPSEASALGAFATFVLVAAYKRLTWCAVKQSLVGTLQITVMYLIILTASTTFSQVLAWTGSTRGLVEAALMLNLHPIMLLSAMLLTLLILGCFMDSTSIMMMTFPLLVPVVNAMGFDPVWWGILTLISLEMGLTTPPFGFLLFILKGVAPKDTTMTDLYLAAFPFVLSDMVAIILLIIFPQIVLWLPNLMRG